MSAARPPSIGLGEAAERAWDVVVIGAGPAGSLTALLVARAGLDVVLVERAAFPRRKVCGCCLNAAALAGLRAAGLGELTERLGARVLTRLRLASPGRSATVPLVAGAALSRELLDTALATEAVRAGCAFLPGTRAVVEAVDRAGRAVALHAADGAASVRARVVIAATGLGGRFLSDEAEFAVEAAGDSRIGAGTVLAATPPGYEAGTIYMAWGERGYVGLVRVERDRLDVAGALDPALVREAGGMAEAATAILRQAGLPVPDGLAESRWQGTPPLTTHRAAIAGERLFLVGDATGYVEPFTGEGMAWALASAHALAPLAAAAVRGWDHRLASQWHAVHAEVIGRRQRLCRVVARSLRRPSLTRGAVRLLAVAPTLAAPFVHAVNAPLHIPLSAVAGRE